MNILDPSASGLILGSEPVAQPGAPNPTGLLDEEILIQFSQALRSAPYAQDVLGNVDRLYAHGSSQTAAVLLESQRNLARTSEQGLFDFTLLHTTLWSSEPVPETAAFDFLSGPFVPVDGVGKVIMVETEGDLLISEAVQFRRVVSEPEYRLYEVAGADHSPLLYNNPLDHSAVARAMFAAGDRWVRSGVPAPQSTLLDEATEGAVDPLYQRETGIARDGDLNARGGVRLPDLAVGRARFIALDLTTTIPGLPPRFAHLSGNTVDLACEPEPGSSDDEPRFSNHGEYVSAFIRQADELQQQGLLLEADAEAMKQRAAESEVGKPGTCAE